MAKIKKPCTISTLLALFGKIQEVGRKYAFNIEFNP
jgi:hypothetical protein